MDRYVSEIERRIFITITLLGIFSKAIPGVESAKVFFYIAAAFCFVVANFRIWADERRKVVSSSPDLRLNIEQMRWQLQGKDTMLIFAVYLWNKGAPSIASNWAARYKMNGAIETPVLKYVSTPWVLKADNQSVTIQPEDQIVFKVLENRLQTGEARSGRIFFLLSGDRNQQIKSLQFEVEITFRDFKGKVCSSRFKPDPKPVMGVAVYPGEKSVIGNKAKK